METTNKTKVCKCCGQELLLEYFSKNARNKDGLQQYCKDCQKAKVREARVRRSGKTLEKQAEILNGAERDMREVTWDKKSEARANLEVLPDSEILAELRRRGYIGRIYKKIEVVI